MRKWLLLGLLVVLIVLAVPYGTGYVMQKQFVSLLKNIPTVDDQVTITLLDYQRGWFHSTAKVNVQISPDVSTDTSSQSSSSFNFIVEENVSHGPLVFDTDANGGRRLVFALAVLNRTVSLAPQSQAALQEKFTGDVPSMKARSVVKFGGDILTSLSYPGFTLRFKDTDARFVVGEMRGDMQITNKQKTVGADLTLSNVNLLTPMTKFDLNKIDLNFKKTRDVSGLWVGNTSLKISKIMSNFKKQPDMSMPGISINEVSLSSKNRVDDDLYFSTNKGSVRKVLVGDISYGPGRYTIFLKNINATASSEFLEKIKAFNPSELTEQQRQYQRMSILSSVPTLFAQGAGVFVQDLHLTTLDGSIDVKGKFLVPQNSQDIVIKPALSTFIQNAFADVVFKFPVVLARKTLNQFYVQFYHDQQVAQKTLLAAKQQLEAQQQLAGASSLATADTGLVNKSQEELSALAVKATEDQLRRWFDAGLLKQDGDSASVKVVYKDQELLINDKPGEDVLKATNKGTSNN